jgi:hypothetical protein
MKYLKKYQLFENQNFKGAYWLVLGNKKECKFLIDKFREKYNIDEREFFNFEYVSNSIIGLFFGNDYISWSSYWEIENEEDIKNGKEYWRGYNATFIGELKLENDELVIDTLKADMEKYNV